MNLPESLRRPSRELVLLEALALVGLIGWVDCVTGWEWSFFVFYALPIVMVVRKADQRWGFVFAVLSALAWWAAQFGNNPYHTNWGFALAVASRLFYFSVLVFAAASVKAQRVLDLARIETLERTQELEREILRTSEREQQRIGRDLHDSLGPHLAAIGYAASFLENELRLSNSAASAKAEWIGELVGEAVSLTRDLARGLFPVQMDASGLSISLEDLARTTSHRRGIAVTFCETGDSQVADPEDGMHLYRIAQEALNNAATHGEARNVTLVLSKGEGSLRLVIADDGRGIPHLAGGREGVGLHSMRFRARALGGEIEIKSSPGEGTIVSCQVPLTHAARTKSVS